MAFFATFCKKNPLFSPLQNKRSGINPPPRKYANLFDYLTKLYASGST